MPSSHRNISYISIVILSSTILVGSLYHGFALPPFTNSDIVLTAVCPTPVIPSQPWSGCKSPLESITIQQNGTYTVYATTRTDQKIASTTTINNIDKTRPVAKSVTYSPRETLGCTQGPVTAKVVFYDGLNLTRLKDRISGFVGGSDAYDTRAPLIN